MSYYPSRCLGEAALKGQFENQVYSPDSEKVIENPPAAKKAKLTPEEIENKRIGLYFFYTKNQTNFRTKTEKDSQVSAVDWFTKEGSRRTYTICEATSTAMDSDVDKIYEVWETVLSILWAASRGH